jgi:hypothetical protein
MQALLMLLSIWWSLVEVEVVESPTTTEVEVVLVVY